MLLTTRITGYVLVIFIFQFITGQYDFTRVDYDYIISAIKVRSIVRFVLTT